jgi:hypothetical protein
MVPSDHSYHRDGRGEKHAKKPRRAPAFSGYWSHAVRGGAQPGAHPESARRDPEQAAAAQHSPRRNAAQPGS